MQNLCEYVYNYLEYAKKSQELYERTMQKRHFELLASIIRAHILAELLAGSDCKAEQAMLDALVKALVNDNSLFDSKRFLRACGM
jgi:hypothetical protein